MNKDKRVELLKDEYIMLQQFYEDIDGKGLNIKNWAITVALATIGAGIVYHMNMLFLVAFVAAIVFWFLEAYWRGLSHFFGVRIKEIESIFRKGKFDREVPLQVYSKWGDEYTRKGDQTLKYMLKVSSAIPHVLIAVISLVLYLLGLYGSL
jgi:hypothetical protein